MTVLSTSRAELDPVHVLRDIVAERRAGNAAQLLHLTRRHVFRQLQVYRGRGLAGLVSQKAWQAEQSLPSSCRADAGSGADPGELS